MRWNLDKCITDALKFTSKVDWKQNSPGAYGHACKNKFLEKCCHHMRRPVSYNKKWTFDTCKISALKYNTSREWEKNDTKAYRAAQCYEWLTECTLHMNNTHPKWTLKDCVKDANKYKYRKEWQLHSSGAYSAAVVNNWLDECCKHMKFLSGTSIAEKEIYNILKTKYNVLSRRRFGNSKIKNRSFELDIFIPELNKAIEYNGNYWHSDIIMLKYKNESAECYHTRKRNFFNSLGISYLEIWEDEWKTDKEACLYCIFKFLEE